MIRPMITVRCFQSTKETLCSGANNQIVSPPSMSALTSDGPQEKNEAKEKQMKKKVSQ